MGRSNGGIIGANPVNLSGVWELSEVTSKVRNDSWTVASPYIFEVNETVYFTVSQSLANDSNSEAHRFGPTQAQIRDFVGGTGSNGQQGKTWANEYLDAPVQGYQRWTIGQSGVYEFDIKGAGAGQTDGAFTGRGQRCTSSFQLNEGDQILIAVGQGVPDKVGDHCNGAGGGTFVAFGGDIATAIPLMVAAGAAGDTSDTGGTQPSTSIVPGISVTDPDTGATYSGDATNVVGGDSADNTDYGFVDPPSTVVGGAFFDQATTGNVAQHGGGFRQGDLIGGIRNNTTAGNGGFGGGSGGFDESGNSSGGFTTDNGLDGPSCSAGGWLNSGDPRYVSTSTFFALEGNTTFQNSDWTSFQQMQGVCKVTRIS